MMASINISTNLGAAVAEDEGQDEEVIDLVLNDEHYQAFRPSEGQMALMASGFSMESGGQEVMSSLMRFMRGVVDDDGYAEIVRLMNLRKGGMGMDDLQKLVGDLVGTWTGFPTQPSSDSTSSQRTSGQRSTGRVRHEGSDRSDFRHDDSATSSTFGRLSGSNSIP